MVGQEYVALVPVKPPAIGKSRLVGLTAGLRRDLATAFALDTVTATLATPAVAAVLAVTDDAALSRELEALGCASVPDGAGGDLNACLRLAAAEAGRRWPSLVPAAVCADLPALLPSDLQAALDMPTDGAPRFVADAAGTGTTMYAAAHGLFAPRFGPDSRSAHLRAGAAEVEGELATLRQDVDDLADLGRVLELGAGPRTARLVGEMPSGWASVTGDPP